MEPRVIISNLGQNTSASFIRLVSVVKISEKERLGWWRFKSFLSTWSMKALKCNRF
jgi:hypothetical protein